MMSSILITYANWIYHFQTAPTSRRKSPHQQSMTLSAVSEMTKNRMSVIFTHNQVFLMKQSNLNPSVLETSISSWNDDAYYLLFTNTSRARRLFTHELTSNSPISFHYDIPLQLNRIRINQHKLLYRNHHANHFRLPLASPETIKRLIVFLPTWFYQPNVHDILTVASTMRQPYLTPHSSNCPLSSHLKR